MDSPLDEYPPAWIAEADQECAQTMAVVRQMIEMHRHDIDLYAEKYNIRGAMSTTGLLAANLIGDDDEPSRSQLAYLFATALDILARQPREQDPLDSLK
jgi:hypothetical protein